MRKLLGRSDEERNQLLGRMWCILGFKDPKLLDEIPYQKEAMLALVVSATQVRNAGKKRFTNIGDQGLHFAYREARNNYTESVIVLRQIHPLFAELPLHWSELPEFIRKWQRSSSEEFDVPVIKSMELLKEG